MKAPGRPQVGIALWLLCVASMAQQGEAAPKYPKTLKSATDGAELVFLAAGQFKIGTNQAQLRELLTKRLRARYEAPFGTELPEQVVVLPALYIDKFEVTNRQYGEFVSKAKGKPSRYRDYPQFNKATQPVTGISWSDADAYCKWAGRRLPTEPEWERAAKGQENRIWPWGNEADASRFNGKTSGRYGAVAVGSFPAGNTQDGVADLAGSVWEFTTSDWSGGGKAMKGGSFLNELSLVRGSVSWASSKQDVGAEYLGFRCIVEAAKLVAGGR